MNQKRAFWLMVGLGLFAIVVNLSNLVQSYSATSLMRIRQSAAVVLATTTPTVTLTLSAATIPTGTPVTISWRSTNVSGCDASGSPEWTGPVATSGVKFVSMAMPGTYSLAVDCYGANGLVLGQKTLVVTAKTTITPSPSAPAPNIPPPVTTPYVINKMEVNGSSSPKVITDSPTKANVITWSTTGGGECKLFTTIAGKTDSGTAVSFGTPANNIYPYSIQRPTVANEATFTVNCRQGTAAAIFKAVTVVVVKPPVLATTTPITMQAYLNRQMVLDDPTDTKDPVIWAHGAVWQDTNIKDLIVPNGQPWVIKWNAPSATSCSWQQYGDLGKPGVLPIKGQVNVLTTVSLNQKYIVKCLYAGGITQTGSVVFQSQPIIKKLMVDSKDVTSSQHIMLDPTIPSHTFLWQTEGGNTCELTTGETDRTTGKEIYGTPRSVAASGQTTFKPLGKPVLMRILCKNTNIPHLQTIPTRVYIGFDSYPAPKLGFFESFTKHLTAMAGFLGAAVAGTTDSDGAGSYMYWEGGGATSSEAVMYLPNTPRVLSGLKDYKDEGKNATLQWNLTKTRTYSGGEQGFPKQAVSYFVPNRQREVGDDTSKMFDPEWDKSVTPAALSGSHSVAPYMYDQVTLGQWGYWVSSLGRFAPLENFIETQKAALRVEQCEVSFSDIRKGILDGSGPVSVSEEGLREWAACDSTDDDWGGSHDSFADAPGCGRLQGYVSKSKKLWPNGSGDLSDIVGMMRPAQLNQADHGVDNDMPVVNTNDSHFDGFISNAVSVYGLETLKDRGRITAVMQSLVNQAGGKYATSYGEEVEAVGFAALRILQYIPLIDGYIDSGHMLVSVGADGDGQNATFRLLDPNGPEQIALSCSILSISKLINGSTVSLYIPFCQYSGYGYAFVKQLYVEPYVRNEINIKNSLCRDAKNEKEYCKRKSSSWLMSNYLPIGNWTDGRSSAGYCAGWGTFHVKAATQIDFGRGECTPKPQKP